MSKTFAVDATFKSFSDLPQLVFAHGLRAQTQIIKLLYLSIAYGLLTVTAMVIFEFVSGFSLTALNLTYIGYIATSNKLFALILTVISLILTEPKTYEIDAPPNAENFQGFKFNYYAPITKLKKVASYYLTAIAQASIVVAVILIKDRDKEEITENGTSGLAA